jgi:hypothetical protein
MFFGAGWLLLQASHLGTFAAMGLVACAGLTMMRQEERSLRTIIMVMVNTPLRSGMVLKIGMEGSDLRHLLLLRSGTELPKRVSGNTTRRLLEGRIPAALGLRSPGRLFAAVGQGAYARPAALPSSRYKAFFDFRINLVKPLLCALCSVPVPFGFSL